MKSCGQIIWWFSLGCDWWQTGMAYPALSMFIHYIKILRAIETPCLTQLAECHSGKMFSLQCLDTVSFSSWDHLGLSWPDPFPFIARLTGTAETWDFSHFLFVAQLRIEPSEDWNVLALWRLGGWHWEAWISFSLQEIQPGDLTVPFGKSSDTISKKTVLRKEVAHCSSASFGVRDTT